MLIFTQFTFDSAHFLPHVPPDHKCRNMHGHTYRLVTYFEGELHPELGWVMDFADIKKIMTPILQQVDHRVLNELEGLENPTCERLAVWLWEYIKPQLPALCKIELHETPTSGVVYQGP